MSWRWSEMTLNQKFIFEVILFVVISGGLGFWIWSTQGTIEELTTKIEKELRPALKQDRLKISKIALEEARKSDFDVRRNMLEVAVPDTRTQDPTDLMRILDSIKRSVESETESQLPLLIVQEGQVEVQKSRQTSKRKKQVAPYQKVNITLNVQSTFLGLLRFIDVMEKDSQLFRIRSLSTELSEKTPGFEPQGSALAGVSPLKDARYVSSQMVIETYNIHPEAVR